MKITKEELKNKTLKSFYIDNRNLLPQSKTPDSWLEHKGYEILEKAGFRTLNQLAILCDYDKQCIIEVLDFFIVLPGYQGLDKAEKELKKYEKIEDQRRKRHVQKRIGQILNDIYSLNPGIDYSTHDKMSYEAVKADPIIEKLSKPKKPLLAKAHTYYNQTILAIYLKCRQKSNISDYLIFARIAHILKSLHIKKLIKGNDYQGNDIKRIIKDYLPKEPAT